MKLHFNGHESILLLFDYKRTASEPKKPSLSKNLLGALLRKPAQSTARPMEALPESAGNHLME